MADGLTPSSPTLGELLRRGDIYWSPLFQRQFDWGKRQVEGCFQDVLTLVDKEDRIRFLGSIVFEKGSEAKFDRPAQVWIIDGQQRLTTLYLILVALVKALLKEGSQKAAVSLTTTSLLSESDGVKCEPKIRPTVMDTCQFNTVLEDLEYEELSYVENPQGHPTGNLITQYKRIQTLLKTELDVVEAEQRVAWLKTFSERLQNGTLFVAIALGADLDAHEVFDRLNTGSQPLTVADLLRNDVMRVTSQNLNQAKALHKNLWLPFEKSFSQDEKNEKKHREAYFFPLALVRDPTTSKADTFHDLRKRLDNLREENDPLTPASEVQLTIADLEEYRDSYCAITGAGSTKDIRDWKTDWTQAEKKVLHKTIKRLNRLNVPTVTLPYFLQLLNETKAGRYKVDDAVACIHVVESFLVRRGIVGLEPTGLHAVFKSLWDPNIKDPLELEKQLTTKTIGFPDDEEVEKHVRSTSMYARKICRYVLWEHNASFDGGDELDEVFWERGIQADHVIPQSVDDPEELERRGWTKQEFDDLLHTWANLVPVTAKLNLKKGNRDFTHFQKIAIDKGHTVFKTTHDVVANNDSWTPGTVRARAKLLMAFAVERWPRLNAD